MSRTTRNPKYYIKYSDVAYANKNKPFYTYMRVEKTDEEYHSDMEFAHVSYEMKLVKSHGRGYENYYDHIEGVYAYRPIVLENVSRFYFVKVPYVEKYGIPNAKEERAKMARDGHFSESGRRKSFKSLAKKSVRNESKKMIQRVMKGVDYDEFCPHDRLGKKHVWSIW